MAAPRRRTTTKTPARRRTVRRRSMGQKLSSAKVNAAVMNTAKAAAGGVIASILTNSAGSVLGNKAHYAGLIGSVATGLFFKQPEIAAGMAGYGGAKVLSNLPGMANFLNDAGAYGTVASQMYLQDGASDVYSSSYTMAGYEVPGL